MVKTKSVIALILLTLLTLPVSVFSQVSGRGTGTCSQKINGKFYQVPCALPSSSTPKEKTNPPDEPYSSDPNNAPPVVPDTLPGLVNDYRAVQSWFKEFPDAPATIQASNLSDVYFGVDRLNGFAVAKLQSLRFQKAALEKRYQDVQSRIGQNVAATDLLRNEIAQLESDISASNREIQETEIQLQSQTARNDHLVAVISEMAREAQSARADLFQTLSAAAQRGLIQPPSSYESLPQAVAPHYRSSNSSLTENPPLQLAAGAAAFATDPPRAASFAAASASNRPVSINETQIRQRLAQTRALIPEINAAVNDVFQNSQQDAAECYTSISHN